MAVGQKVTTGQTLATINSTALSDDVSADQATLTSDQDRLSTDQAAAASTSQVDSDQAAITQAQSQLATAETNLSDATLKATFNGTVAAVNLSVGQQVSAGNSGSTGSSGSSGTGGTGGTGASGGLASALAALGASTSSSSSNSSSEGITVISTDAYTITTSVDDTEVGQLKVGDQAVMTLSGSTSAATGRAAALAGPTAAGGTSAAGANAASSSSGDIYGVVSSVSLIASSSSSSVASFPVVITVTGTPSGLYAGASTTVSIITEQLNDVVEVPTAAISYTTGSPTVTKVVGGKNVTEPVTTGIAASGETQITAGLKAGDVITERVVSFNASAANGRGPFPLRRVPGPVEPPVPEAGARAAPASGAAVVPAEVAAAWSAAAQVADEILRLEDVTKIYRTGTLSVAALRGVSSPSMQGEYVSIIGPSGSGKSTLMHILGCLDVRPRPVWLAGEDVSAMSEVELAEVRTVASASSSSSSTCCLSPPGATSSSR